MGMKGTKYRKNICRAKDKEIKLKLMINMDNHLKSFSFVEDHNNSPPGITIIPPLLG
jgi:hypothetical protein